MAVINSLICWGGLTGKGSWTVSTAADQLTLSNHGIHPTSVGTNGFGVRFSGGTLPTVSGTALSTSTTYYAKWISTSVIELYREKALTTKVDFTAAGTGWVLKSALITDPATELAAYGLSDTTRWGTRIYDGVANWVTGRAGALSTDEEIGEIGEAFIHISSGQTLNIPAAKTTLYTKINGIRTSGFHGGVLGNGFILSTSYSYVAPGRAGQTIDGFTIQVSTGTSGACVSITQANFTVDRMILRGTAKVASSIGLYCTADASTVRNCLITDLDVGMALEQYYKETVYANNTVVGNNSGIIGRYSATTLLRGKFFNNISIGNSTVNWGSITAYETLMSASNNAGLSGEAWMNGTGSTRITMATTDFADFAGKNFTPASASSPQTDSAIQYYNIQPYDLRDAVRPSYENGAATEYDVGCFEFDHGYGPWPATHVLTLTNVVVGSRVFIRDQADTTTHFDQIAAASTVVATVTLFGDSRDSWRIRVRKASSGTTYVPYETLMTATVGGSSIYVSQVPDE